jgi:hypothetical protein
MLLLILFIIFIIIYETYKNIEKYVSFMPQKLFIKNKGYYKNIYDQIDIFNIDNEYDEYGYRKNGFNRDGFNKKGYNRYGYDIYGFNVNGLNKYGFDKAGINKDGFNKKGFKYDISTNNSYNYSGFDENGYNKNGYDESGYDKYGYDINGINKYGFDINGVNKKLRPNIYKSKNKIFNTYPFNLISKKQIIENNNSIQNTLDIEDKKINDLKEINKKFKKKETCVDNLPGAYLKYGCNLFNYYNKCKKCTLKGPEYCAVYDISSCPSSMTQEECTKQNKWNNGGMRCAKTGDKLPNGQIFKCPDNFKCINPPDHNPAGFGCRDINNSNIEPIDPIINGGNVCVTWNNNMYSRNITNK